MFYFNIIWIALTLIHPIPAPGIVTHDKTFIETYDLIIASKKLYFIKL